MNGMHVMIIVTLDVGQVGSTPNFDGHVDPILTLSLIGWLICIYISIGITCLTHVGSCLRR